MATINDIIYLSLFLSLSLFLLSSNIASMQEVFWSALATAPSWNLSGGYWSAQAETSAVAKEAFIINKFSFIFN